MAVSIAIIGVGAPWHHLPALAHLKNAAIVAVCDIEESRLAEAARAHRIAATYIDYKRMLDRVTPQAVYVLPSVLRTIEIATECLDRRLHVFVEKPPGLRAAETRELARLARDRGVISMVGFNRRFHPLVSAARAVFNGAGRPSVIIAEWFKPLLMEDMGRTHPPAVLDRLLAVTTIHSVDLLRFLGGDVDEVHAVAERSYSPYIDAVHALLRFRKGGVGVLLSDYHTTKLERLQIHGRGVLVEVSGAGEPYREGRIFKDGRWHVLLAPPGERTDPDGFFEEDQHFIDRVAAGRPVTPEGADLDEAVRTMELADAIAAAAGTV